MCPARPCQPEGGARTGGRRGAPLLPRQKLPAGFCLHPHPGPAAEADLDRRFFRNGLGEGVRQGSRGALEEPSSQTVEVLAATPSLTLASPGADTPRGQAEVVGSGHGPR